MTPTYNAGDRVTIDWEAVYGSLLDLDAYELRYFEESSEYYGTIQRDYHPDDEYLIIEWDEKYHSHMYGNNQWNLDPKVVKLVEPIDPKKAIETRIIRTYAKSKLPFVQNWSK